MGSVELLYTWSVRVAARVTKTVQRLSISCVGEKKRERETERERESWMEGRREGGRGKERASLDLQRNTSQPLQSNNPEALKRLKPNLDLPKPSLPESPYNFCIRLYSHL